ncbi:MAG: F0F1 ATP synthase subunit A [Bdellovibrionales bacterium]
MEAHFSWLYFIPGVNHDNIHVATLLVASSLLILLGAYARVTLGAGEVAIEPAKGISVRGFFELIYDLIIYLIDMVIGHDGRKYATLFASVFLFVLFNNLIGLLPGMTAATDNFNTTFALGIFSFVMYNAYGIKANGVVNYVKHFMGPVWWLAWMILPIELLSHAIRPVTLGLRIMGNIQADHGVLSIFLNMAPYGVPMIFYAMGLFVCFMQAFIFTLLSMVYVSIATAHDH